MDASKLKAAPVDLSALDALAEADVRLIWSKEHRAYWRASSSGYCGEPLGAGIYERAKAEAIVASVNNDPAKTCEVREIADVLGEASAGTLGFQLLALRNAYPAIKAEIEALRGQVASARADEREACARVAEAEEVAFGSDEYATGQPDSSFGERFACRQIAAALRNRTPSPPAKEKKT